MELHKRASFIHHQHSRIADSIREVVFGAEDGMVSTLGALTGIAAGTSSRGIVILAGFVIVCVESISMGVGSYLSSRSTQRLHKRMLDEERIELKELPHEEELELIELYRKDGWPDVLAEQMAKTASKDEELFLKEMAYRELHVLPEVENTAVRDGIIMFISYVIGGLIPVAAYLVLSVQNALPVSIGITLIGLFILGVFTTRFTKQHWFKSGMEMFLLASTAAVIGFIVGRVADALLLL